jgi:putative phage-type endonuclease
MTHTPEIAHKRKGGIGGSEVSAILGIDSYSSPYQIWLRKTGREAPFFGNKYTKAGNILESAVVEYFSRETKYRIIKSSADQKVIIHPKYTFAIGMMDRLYVKTSTIGKGVLECKTTQASYDDVPSTWFTQLQWYLGVSQLSYGAVAWLEKGLDFKYREYEHDPEYFKFCIDAVKVFWEENILKDIPPEPINIIDVNHMFTRHIEGSKMEATPEMIAVYDELNAIRKIMKDCSKTEEDLISKVKIAMRDIVVVLNKNKPIFSWRTTAPIHCFDSDKLKNSDIDVYNAYSYEKPGIRRFLIK